MLRGAAFLSGAPFLPGSPAVLLERGNLGAKYVKTKSHPFMYSLNMYLVSSASHSAWCRVFKNELELSTVPREYSGDKHVNHYVQKTSGDRKLCRGQEGSPPGGAQLFLLLTPGDF